MKIPFIILLPLIVLASDRYFERNTSVTLKRVSVSTRSNGIIAQYEGTDRKQFRVGPVDPFLYFMVPSENKNIQITNLRLSHYRDLNDKVEIERQDNKFLYRIFPAQFFQGTRYFPVQVYPFKNSSSGNLQIAENVSFDIINPQTTTPVNRAKINFKKTSVFDTNSEWWVFNVEKPHVFEITRNDVEKWNINAANPEDVHFFSFNGAMLPYLTNTGYPEELPELPVYIENYSPGDGWQDDERILVYTRGVDFFQYDSLKQVFSYHHHLYAEKNNLWLAVDNTYPAPILNETGYASGTQVFNYAQAWEHYEKDEINRLKSGTTWFEKALNINNNPFRINLSIDNSLLCYACDNPVLKINLAIAGGNNFLYKEGSLPQIDQLFDVDFENDGATQSLISNYNVGDYSYAKITMNQNLETSLVNPSVLITYKPHVIRDITVEEGKYYYDYYELNYPISLIALDEKVEQKPFYYKYDSQTIEFDLGEADQSTMLWNTTFAFTPTVTKKGSGGHFVPGFSKDRMNSFIIVTPDNREKLPDPQQLNYLFKLRDKTIKSDLIIVAPEEFYDKAVEYAQAREKWSINPFNVEVVKVEDIYREFSGGVKDVAAIRNFFRYCWEQRNDKPRFAMFMGDGNYDPKGIIYNGVNRDFIPTFQIDYPSELGSYTTDFYFANLNATSNSYGEIVPEIPLGRLPVSSLSQIDHYIEKLENYGQLPTSNGWEEDFLLIADDLYHSTNTSETFHYTGAEAIYNYIPERFNVFKLYTQQYPSVSGGIGRIKPAATKEFLNRVNQGQGIVVYIGHGSPDKWTDETLYDLKLHRNLIANDFTNGLWMALSCDISKFDDPGRETMGEDLVNRQSSGAMWVFAATRLVQAFSNNNLGTYVIQWLLDKPEKYTVGEALTLTVQYTYSLKNGDYQNTLKYVLFGDPSLSLLEGRIPVTFNNIRSLDTLKSLQKVFISGEIGDTLRYPDFTGNAVLRIYDSQDTLKYPFGSTTTIYYTLGPGLYRGQLKVENGAFSANFIVPKSIKYSPKPKGKIWFYAYDRQTGEYASQVKNDVVFYGSSSNIEDSSGPNITISIDGTNSGIDGDIIRQDSKLVITLIDSSGINVSGETGHEIVLRVDDMENVDLTDFFVYDENSAVSGKLVYPLNSLTMGKHDFVLKAWDNANNPNEYNFHFEVAEAGKIILENVVNYPNPMDNETWFTCQTTAASGEIIVMVYTLGGRKIKTLRQNVENQSFQRVYWDGRDDNGNELANGTYLYRFKLISGDVTKTVLEKLVILK